MKKTVGFLMALITLMGVICNGINIYANTTSYEKIQDYYSYRGLNPIQSVVDINIQKIENPNNYEPIFVVEYVADTKNYSDIINTLNEVQAISDDICKDIDTDYEKLQAIYKYVVDNIAYDFDAAHNAVTVDIICLKNVLANKRTTCAGFSNLFSALCQAQGFEVVNIRGSAMENDDYNSIAEDTAPINHEWTAVRFNGEWTYMDCTWDSHNKYQNGEFEMNKGTMLYFEMSLETVSVAHKAHIVDYRNFFNAPNAFNEYGELITDTTTGSDTSTTPPTDTPIITEPTTIDYPIDEPTEPIPDITEENIEETTEVTTRVPLPETWRVTSKTTTQTTVIDDSSSEAEILETLEETAETTLKKPVNTNFSGIDWMRPSEKLEPYIIVVMVLGLGSAIAIAVTIGTKKKK